ncbi:MYND-type domain-containing protein [Mycena indigotica]|uniref:MYND-type domain-containing protein n=1 Tax=Mycena indigotica TaxID=2126181 RepID=A0A8H6RZ37_9AGAR|nr:MYND-type domain-containing protein [Mycena indigotica]KAF7288882.1 MYND-type domain-containing protein [Mycena indigotica]
MAKHLAERPSGARVLAETGGVPILIRALHAASTKFLDLFEGENTIYDILSCLVLIFSSRPFYPDVAVAFENNLIPAIMACARSQRMRPLSRDALNQLKLLLTRTLPAAMVYSSVVRALAQGEKAMLSTADYWEPIGTDELLGTPLHEEYKGFMVLLATRLCDYDIFRSGAHSDLRACDNHLCNIIQPTAKFKRCAQCVESYYCSSICQKVAWRQNGHRTRCTPLSHTPQKFPGSSDTLLHKRDDRFLRLIIQQHYMRSSFELLQQQLAYIRETRRTDFVLEFIFTAGHPVEVQVTHLPFRQEDGFDRWPADAPPLTRCLVALDAGGGHGKKTEMVVRTYLLRRAPGASEELARRMVKLASEMQNGDICEEGSVVYRKLQQISVLDVVEVVC